MLRRQSSKRLWRDWRVSSRASGLCCRLNFGECTWLPMSLAIRRSARMWSGTAIVDGSKFIVELIPSGLIFSSSTSEKGYEGSARVIQDWKYDSDLNSDIIILNCERATEGQRHNTDNNVINQSKPNPELA